MRRFVLILIIFSFYKTKSQSNNLVNTEWRLISIQDKTLNKTFVFSDDISLLSIKDSMMHMNTCNYLHCGYKIDSESKKIKCFNRFQTKVKCHDESLVIENYYTTHFTNLNYYPSSDTLALSDSSVYFKYLRKN